MCYFCLKAQNTPLFFPSPPQQLDIRKICLLSSLSISQWKTKELIQQASLAGSIKRKSEVTHNSSLCRTGLLLMNKCCKIYWKASTASMRSHSPLMFSLPSSGHRDLNPSSTINCLYFSSLPELDAGNLLDEALSIILFLLFPSSPHFSVECALSYGAYSQLLVFYTGPRAVCIHSEYECSSFMGRRRKILVHFSFCPCCKTNV